MANQNVFFNIEQEYEIRKLHRSLSKQMNATYDVIASENSDLEDDSVAMNEGFSGDANIFDGTDFDENDYYLQVSDDDEEISIARHMQSEGSEMCLDASIIKSPTDSSVLNHQCTTSTFISSCNEPNQTFESAFSKDSARTTSTKLSTKSIRKIYKNVMKPFVQMLMNRSTKQSSDFDASSTNAKLTEDSAIYTAKSSSSSEYEVNCEKIRIASRRSKDPIYDRINKIRSTCLVANNIERTANNFTNLGDIVVWHI